MVSGVYLQHSGFIFAGSLASFARKVILLEIMNNGGGDGGWGGGITLSSYAVCDLSKEFVTFSAADCSTLTLGYVFLPP